MTSQVSHPYNSTDFTQALNILILISFLDAVMKMTLNYGGQLSIRDVARALFYQCCSRTSASNVFNSNIHAFLLTFCAITSV